MLASTCSLIIIYLVVASADRAFGDDRSTFIVVFITGALVRQRLITKMSTPERVSECFEYNVTG